MILTRARDLSHWRRRGSVVRYAVAALVLVVVLAPSPGQATTCEEWVRKTVRLTGAYVPAGEAYSRRFVFAMRLDCDGTKEVVTVARATGNLPVCRAQQQVEVVGTLIWNKALVDGHYEINDPASVTCLAEAPEVARGPEPRQVLPPVPAGPPAGTEAPRAEARAVGVSVWVGRYQDSRGAGDVTFTLLRGESMLSGTWKLRTGGGGPVTGSLEAGGRRMQLRMENLAPECRGTFEGTAEISDTTLVATYQGKDCEGAVTGGHLDLRVR
jgi:hypothetical protein